MRLNFTGFKIPKETRLLVATNDNNRIEIHVKDNMDTTFTLISITGKSNGGIDRSLRQGPYTTREQALAAMQAICNELQRLGYCPNTESSSIWEIKVQQEINILRQVKKENQGNYKFHPNDVLPDPWNK